MCVQLFGQSVSVFDEYQPTNMLQYRFIAFLIVHSSLVGLQSKPLPGDLRYRRIRACESFLAERAPDFPTCPYQMEPYGGWRWGFHCLFAILLVLLTGILAGLTLAVMSVDVTRLRVWMNTGGEKQRFVLEPSSLSRFLRLTILGHEGNMRQEFLKSEAAPIGSLSL